jgi:hypothetical protein
MRRNITPIRTLPPCEGGLGGGRVAGGILMARSAKGRDEWMAHAFGLKLACGQKWRMLLRAYHEPLCMQRKRGGYE